MPKKDGKPYVWEGVTQAKREKLGYPERSFKPWTGRPGTRKGGISKQLSEPNFIDELLDCRMIESQQRAGAPIESGPQKKLMADVGQEIRHQLASDTAIMLSKSKLYSYFRDRCAIPEEHFYFQGWGHEVQLDCVTDDPIESKRQDLQDEGASTKKKRRGKRPQYQDKSKSLIGNAECLPDLASIIIPLVFVLNIDGVFKHKLQLSEVPYIDAGAPGLPGADVCVLNPESSRAQVQGLVKTISADPDHVVEALDSEEEKAGHGGKE